MIAFIDDHRDAYGVEPICRVLPIAPSTYHERVAQRQDPTRLSTRARQDVALKPEIGRVFAENIAVYGVRRMPCLAGHATRESKPQSGPHLQWRHP